MGTRWTYDPAVDAADLILVPEGAVYGSAGTSTIDLEGAHVLLDVDGDGRVVSVEILGPARHVQLAGLAGYLKEEANQ